MKEPGKLLKERRNKVLAMLDENPEIQRAFITDTKLDQHNVLVTIAIRNVATFEMLIPKNKYDAFLLMEVIHKESK